MRTTGPIYNFAGGPAVMPKSVLIRAQDELLDWHNTGMSVLEMPFSGTHFISIMASAKQKIRDILAIPANYQILFMQGGASTQFSLIPMNLLSANGHATYIDTGYWSLKAASEAKNYGTIHLGASVKHSAPLSIPALADWRVPAQSEYCHITSNETATGVAFHADPKLKSIPLIADMTSDFMSRPICIENYGLIYAGTQKNIGPTGLVILIIRDDLIKKARPEIPNIFSYQEHLVNNNRLNTPLTYSIYLTDLACDWIIQQGGVLALAQRNQQRADKLYALLDADSFYSCHVEQQCRSVMNLCFQLPNTQLERAFLAAAEQQGLLNLQGHQQVGGIRASLYNAQTADAINALTDFMEDFRATHSSQR